jgi:hypothetical protein
MAFRRWIVSARQDRTSTAWLPWLLGQAPAVLPAKPVKAVRPCEQRSVPFQSHGEAADAVGRIRLLLLPVVALRSLLLSLCLSSIFVVLLPAHLLVPTVSN